MTCVDTEKRSILHHAFMEINYASYDVIKSILFRSCIPTSLFIPDVHGNTPLHYACQTMHPMITFLLEMYGKDAFTAINLPNNDGHTPLHLALKYGNDVATDLLSDFPSLRLDLTDNEKRTPAHYAAMQTDINIFGTFFQIDNIVDKVELNAQDGYGMTPLHYACLNENHSPCLFLSTQIPDDDIGILVTMFKDCHGSTPLHYACSFGMTLNVVSLLINAPQAFAVWLNLTDGFGKMPLQYVRDDSHIFHMIEDWKQGKLDYDKCINALALSH